MKSADYLIKNAINLHLWAVKKNLNWVNWMNYLIIAWKIGKFNDKVESVKYKSLI